LYPEIADSVFKGVQSAIFDCEIVVVDNNGKSIFYGGINQRDKVVKSAEHRAKYPVKALLFDCIYLNGQVLSQKPYTERYQLLRQSITDSSSIEVVRNIDNPKEYWEKVIVPENREGLVLKNPKAIYQAGQRVDTQLKLKHYKRNNVIVDKLEPNPKGVKIYGHFELAGQTIQAEVQWSSMGCENIKTGDEVEVEYLDIVNNKLVQPHKVKGSVID
jgi:DNA ligase-1